VNTGEVHVWRVRLNDVEPLSPTPGEAARAARFRFERHRQQYLRSHAALRAILHRYTGEPLAFAVTEAGKPYLPGVPQLKFNLAHSYDMALVAVALDTEVGVDVEHIRALSNYAAMAERFFPPSEAADVLDERDFFRRWTRIEAVLKARGIGLNDLGSDPAGEWSIEQIDVGPEYSGAVALPLAVIQVVVRDFGGMK
jgi:4'-phosphopantetheinyl transferase